MKHMIRSSVLRLVSLCLISGFSWQVYADSQSGGLSYSPDHWPNRWSSAIRQKQNGKFPSREQQKQQIKRHSSRNKDSVYEDDLFYSPDSGRRYNRDYDRNQFGDHVTRYRHIRDARRLSREAAYAYNDMANMTGPYGGYNSYYGNNFYGIGIDPVLGHPGIGIPFLPGTPLGYPIGLHPFGAWPYGGYPLGTGAWNPPFGAW